LRADPDYAINALRIQNRQELERKLAGIFRTRTAAEWIRVLSDSRIPSSLVLILRRWWNIRSCGSPNVSVDAACNGGHTSGHGFADQMSETPGRPSSAAPLLGQDTPTALKELLGTDDEMIRKLTAEGVILPVPRAAEAASRDRLAARTQ
jgi:crotonobetainyl-CoA:carnitine CoA-transferase CaiB-like acyl-CoA transferase